MKRLLILWLLLPLLSAAKVPVESDIKARIEAGEAVSLAIRFADSDADGESLIQISNVDAPVELNKYIPKRMPKIRFVAGGEQS